MADFFGLIQTYLQLGVSEPENCEIQCKSCKAVLSMLILYSRVRRFIVDLKSYFTMSSSDLYAAVRNAILENNVEALEQLKLSLNEDNRAASTISSDESFEYGLLS